MGTDQLFAAKPDGLTIGDTNASGDVFDQMTSTPGAYFDLRKFEWIGRPDNETHVIVVLTSSAYKSFADLLKAKTPVPVIATGVGSSEYFGELITLNAFGIPFRILAAYNGSANAKAGLIRGDGDLAEFSYDTLRSLIDAGTVKAVAQQRLKRWPVLADLPTTAELAQQQGLSADKIRAIKALAGILALGHAFAAPPGVPRDRLAYLREAFKKSVSDPAFQAEVKKAHSYIEYGSPEELRAIVDQGLSERAAFKSLNTTK